MNRLDRYFEFVREWEQWKMGDYRRAQPEEKTVNQLISSQHNLDENGNPAGGSTSGIGIAISWQNGPLGRGENRIPPNGAFVEGVIAAALDRLNFYQSTKFKCRENSLAITKLEEALHWCQHRTANRETRDVEGTHQL